MTKLHKQLDQVINVISLLASFARKGFGTKWQIFLEGSNSRPSQRLNSANASTTDGITNVFVSC
jgi:hypothetical protein